MEEAWAGFCADSWPMGAVIADGKTDAVITRGRNLVGERTPGSHPLSGSSVAHAELIALGRLKRVPAQRHKKPRMYCTTEPCPMCVGALGLSIVRQVAYIARDPLGGASSALKQFGVAAAQAQMAELQDVIITLMTVRAHTFYPRRYWPRIDALGRASPRGLALGKELYRTKVMRRLREQGADAETMVDALLARAPAK